MAADPPTQPVQTVQPLDEGDLSGLVKVFNDLLTELTDERKYRREAEVERKRAEEQYRSSRRTNWFATVVIVAALLVVIFVGLANRHGVDVINSCVNPPKHPSAAGHLTCYEKAQANTGGTLNRFLSAQDIANKQRYQELLDAINNHQPTITFAPLPPNLIPMPTTTTTVPKA